MRINKWGEETKNITYSMQWNWLVLRLIENSERGFSTEDIIEQLEKYGPKWYEEYPNRKGEFKAALTGHLSKMLDKNMLIYTENTDDKTDTWSCTDNNFELLVSAAKLMANSIDLDITASPDEIAWEEEFEFSMIKDAYILRMLLLSSSDLRDVIRLSK